jgi:hypothetical protein
VVTTTMPPRTRTSSTNGHAPSGMRISPTKPRRNSALIAVGVLLMVGCGLIAAVLQMRATTKTAVLTVAHQVPVGQVVRSSDLSTVSVSVSGGDGLRVIPAADRSSVVGRTAVVALMPGTLVSRSQIGDGSAVTKGKVVIGLSLKPGQMPTSNLKAGDQVVLVSTTPANQAADAGANQPRAAVLVDRATVFGVEGGSRNNDNTTVSVLIDEADAPAVAAAASASQVTLVLLAAP